MIPVGQHNIHSNAQIGLTECQVVVGEWGGTRGAFYSTAELQATFLRPVQRKLRDWSTRSRLKALLATVALTSACTSSPMAPTPTPAITRQYVVIGDSVGAWGQWWPAVEATLPAHTFVNAAVPFTFLHTNWQPGGTAWEAMTAEVSRPTAYLVHLGANDTVWTDPVPTPSGVFADLQTFVRGLHQLSPGSVVYLAEVGQVWTYGDKRVEDGIVLKAIHRAWGEIPGVRPGPAMQDLTPDDGVHFTGAVNTQVIGNRWIAVLGGQ